MTEAGELPQPARRSDPERGFRGVMSGALLLQAITVLLGLPVASAEHDLAAWQLIVVLGLAVACVFACSWVKKPWITPLIIGLQVVNVLCWFVHPALGVMGLIFGAVWWVLFYFRNEFRKREAAGVLPSQQGDAPSS